MATAGQKNIYLPWATVSIVLAVAVLVLRFALFNFGLLYGDDAVFAANIVSAGVLLGAVFVVARWLASRAANEMSTTEVVGLAAGLLGLATAAFGAVQLLAPSTPIQAAAPACRGAAVQGAKFLAQTVPGGVNARVGPGTGYKQTGRFSGSCTLGFDGYCIGEPIANEPTELVDSRWLILHHRDDMVSSAKLQSQSPQDQLGAEPAEQCDSLGGLAQPKSISFTATKKSSDEISLTADARNAQLVGYGVRVIDPVDHGYAYSLIGLKDDLPNFAATWKTDEDVARLPSGTGVVELAASPCLAADKASGEIAVYRVSFRNYEISTIKKSTVSGGRRQFIAATACSGPA